jgi:hypothetical protein
VKITLEPTNEFGTISHPEFPEILVQVRVWKGRTSEGSEVLALVAGVRLPAESTEADRTGLLEIFGTPWQTEAN